MGNVEACGIACVDRKNVETEQDDTNVIPAPEILSRN